MLGAGPSMTEAGFGDFSLAEPR
ncbi:hypothetical protein AGR13a_Cc210094 [Agrobacterium genomosp. 13 str. CFBP 6927]|uniref:Uncharacterized protein n=1 Tax=Agrobacterium genomosp. 13 str. CFBP 6927 TaxID=1183428 RepID=A0ABM9VDC1_9HYPH|nr:hypothetical protein AGR13a_Cc210094 [Agrobacterium genomosp. 13 str. CFBP 6927]